MAGTDSHHRPGPSTYPHPPPLIQLPHLALAVRPGSDAAVKQFLAFRLGELRGDCTELSSELERTQARQATGGGVGQPVGRHGPPAC